VQLKYSTDEANKIMLAEVQRNQALYAKFRASKSFRELDAQTDKIENQKIEEIRAMQGN
jgi:predicted site-specific integrase-resolvase